MIRPEQRRNAHRLYHEASYEEHLAVVAQMQKDGYFQAASSRENWAKEKAKAEKPVLETLTDILGEFLRAGR